MRVKIQTNRSSDIFIFLGRVVAWFSVWRRSNEIFAGLGKMDSKKPKTKGLNRENPYLPRNHEHLVATETAPSSRLNISTNLWSPVVSGADSAIGCSRTPLNHGARPQPFALAFTKPFAIRRLSATFATCPWTSPMLTAPPAESPSSRAPTTIVPNATSLCADYASRGSSKWTLSIQEKTGTGPEEIGRASCRERV